MIFWTTPWMREGVGSTTDLDAASILQRADAQLGFGRIGVIADLHQDGEVKEILEKMASQELKHKEKVEYLYANTAFPQTSGG